MTRKPSTPKTEAKAELRKVSADLIRAVVHYMQDAGEHGATYEELAAHTKTSDRQLYAAIKAIEADGGIVRRKPKVSGECSARMVLDAAPASEEGPSPISAIVLSMALANGAPRNEVSYLQDMIEERMNLGDRRRMEALQASMVVHGAAGEDSVPGILDSAVSSPILDALSVPRRRLKIVYRAAHGDHAPAPREHTISPFRLVHDQFTGVVYLVAKDHTPSEDDKPKDLALFALHRVQEAEATELPASQEPRNLERYVSHMIGGWSDDGATAQAQITITKNSWIRALNETEPSLPNWQMEVSDAFRDETASARFDYAANKPLGALRWLNNLLPFVHVTGPAPLQRSFIKDLGKGFVENLEIAPAELQVEMIERVLPKLQALYAAAKTKK